MLQKAVKSMNATHADPVWQKSPVPKVATDQQSDHHPTFSKLGNFEVNHVDIKEGLHELHLNQDVFVSKFLPNDYDKPNLEDVVNKIISLTEEQGKLFLAVLIKNDRVFQGFWGQFIGERIKLKLKPNANPVWNTSYPTPLKHRAAVEMELQHQCNAILVQWDDLN